MHRGHVLQGKGDSIVMSRMDVVKCVKSSFHMPSSWLVAVQQQKQVDGGKIRTSGISKSTNAANQTLVSLFPSNLSWRIVVVSRWSNRVDGNARPIWSSRRGRSTQLAEEALNQIRCKSGLSEVNGDRQEGNAPREMDA